MSRCVACEQELVNGECGGEGEGICVEMAMAQDFLQEWPTGVRFDADNDGHVDRLYRWVGFADETDGMAEVPLIAAAIKHLQETDHVHASC